jgi:hypothetical protein
MNKISNALIITMLAVAMVSCSGSKKVQGPPPIPQPEWAKNRPTSQTYYYGIGIARKTFDVNQYQQAARQNALSDMAGEISISISSNSVIHAFESNLSFREDFTSTIRAQTQQDLEGYELVDTWEDAENYWVFYKLSKSHYNQLKEQKRNNAVVRSLDFFTSGIDACDAGNIRLALVQLVKALEPIKPYFSEPLPVDFRGSQIFLGNEIFKEISATLSGLEIIPLNGEVSVKTGQGLSSSSLQFQARFRAIGNISELPLIVSYSEKPIRNNRKRTEKNGIASFEIDVVRSNKSHETLTATIDIDEILIEGTTDAMIRRMISRFNLPQGSVRVNIEKPIFAIVSNEVNMGEKLSPGILYNSFQKKSIEGGYVIKEKSSEADYVVYINVLTKKAGQTGNYKNAALEGSIKVETPTGKQIYYKSLEGFTGRHFNEKDAGSEAIKEVQRRLEVTYFREIHEAISKR